VIIVRAEGTWKRLYANLFGASLVYAVASEFLNAAIARGAYYSGSAYDLLLLVSICWFVWAAIEGHRLKLQPAGRPQNRSRWVAVAPRMAMLAILSLPAMGMWALLFDTSAPRLRTFRLFACLTTMLVLGAFVFLKQYLLDHQVMKLLESSDRSYRTLQRLQNELVQKEKLASLGQLVAGAAHEINNPVTAILGYAELLSSDPCIPAEQVSMARKIGQQARRTRDLVADLLSFAQQTPAEKAPVDVSMLLQRAVQMQIARLDAKTIRAELQISPGLPTIIGNANQLLQSFVQIIGNAVDALEESAGGTITVSAYLCADQLVLEFSDTGPGIREPHRVFDPFYTTKPIGKGTGLGLSATYGVIQKHGGQITCRNKADGGAVFTIYLPVAHPARTPSTEAAHA
jgi:signal transduction histidine kinase